ncbi:MAG: hypothetical protein IT562_20585 [Alphaproteobacteria bacterium]|nr:hypothetical protein [Alphaproteobacteria bacterium]
MLYVILFEDDPDKLAVREQHMQAHIDWLERNKDRVLVAGSLREGAGAAPQGGMWIVDVVDRAAADAIYRDDPFWTEGLRKSVTVKYWSKAFPDRKIKI